MSTRSDRALPALLDAGVTGLLVAGAWAVSERRLVRRDHWTGKAAAEVSVAGPDDVVRAVDAAVALAAAWRDRPPSTGERARWLAAAATHIEAEGDRFVAAIIADTGFTLRDARLEVARAVGTLRLCAQEATRIGGELVPLGAQAGADGRIAFTLREPLGVVCAIGPFNSPLNTVCHKVGPALAAGNAVILKPASATPITATLLCQALMEAGVPDGALSLLVGPGATVGRRLLEDRRIRGYTFTGSTEVGLEVKQRTGVAKVHLELGANSPTVVLADASVARVTEAVGRAGYRKAGQVCTSVQRLIVEADAADAVADALAALVSRLSVGDPRDEATDVGPMIDEAAAARAEAMVADAVAKGARVLCGGRREGPLFAPTLLDGVDEGMRVAQEEIFAPVVAIMRAPDMAAAERIANGTSYGLQAGVFTQDVDKALWLCRRLAFGGVMVNDSSSYHADAMPYGGVKDSGVGLEGPRYAIEEMTAPKIVVLNPLDTP